MSALTISHLDAGTAEACPDSSFDRMVEDAAALRKSCGYIDFAALRALGWTKAQLDAHGAAAASEAIRRAALLDDRAVIHFHAAALPAAADLDDEPHLLEEIIRDGLAWRDALRLLPRIIAAARALRATGLGMALACITSKTAAADCGEALAAAADRATPFAPLGFAVLFCLAAACAALLVATIADRIFRSGGR